MLKRLTTLFIVVPIAIVVLMLAVSNRDVVQLNVPPFAGDKPFLAFDAPVYAIVFASLLLGMFLGGFAAWLKQGKYRKLARTQKAEATKWHFEADKEKERAEELAQKVAEADGTASGPALPSPPKAA